MEHKIKGDHFITIAVDIDGTLNCGNENIPMIDRISNRNMVALLKRLVGDGYVVVLYTARDILRKVETELWLKRNHILIGKHYHDIIYDKLKYDVIIDDKSFNPGCGSGNETIPEELEEIAHLMDVYLD